MPVLRSHTRYAGLLASLIALPLLVMPQPTHATERQMLGMSASMLTSGASTSRTTTNRR
jgi:hypothetical protein